MLIYPNTAPHGLKDLVLSAAIALPVPTPDRFSFTSLLTGGTFRPDPARPHFGVCISVTVCLCPHEVWLSWSGGMPRCTLSGWHVPKRIDASYLLCLRVSRHAPALGKKRQGSIAKRTPLNEEMEQQQREITSFFPAPFVHDYYFLVWPASLA